MLIVIDCQKEFSAVDLVVDPIIKEISRAKKRGEWVMLLTYGGRTVSRITRHLRGYGKTVRVHKNNDDGGAAIFDRLHSYHWRNSQRLKDKHVGRISSVRVVGVNTSACVMKTVSSLRLFARTTVIKNACANSSNMRGMFLPPEAHHNAALKRMSKWSNVRVV